MRMVEVNGRHVPSDHRDAIKDKKERAAAAKAAEVPQPPKD